MVKYAQRATFFISSSFESSADELRPLAQTGKAGKCVQLVQFTNELPSKKASSSYGELVCTGF